MPDLRCGYCDGDGEITNPGNLNPHRRLEDWLRPIPCGRCGGSGKDPDGVGGDELASGVVASAPVVASLPRRPVLRVVRGSGA